MKHTQQSGAKVYNPFTLSLYDWWVLNISNKYARSVLLIHDYFLSSCITWARLTDIGVGTGYYLKHAPATHAISLMDLNPDSLKIAASRVGNTKIRATLQHDVFDTFPADWHGRFDSVSMYYLLHCLPG